MEKYGFNQFCLKYFVGEGGTWATVGSPGSTPRRGSAVGGTIPAGLRGTRHERVLNRIFTGLRLVLALAAFPLPFPTSYSFPQLPDQSKAVLLHPDKSEAIPHSSFLVGWMCPSFRFPKVGGGRRNFRFSENS
jgi:hypothetical protein